MEMDTRMNILTSEAIRTTGGILLIGGGGHCRSVLDSILSLNRYEKIGIVDFEQHTELGVPTVGTDDDLPDLFKSGWTEAVITVGSVGNTGTRRRLFHLISHIGFNMPSIIDPSAIIATGTEIGQGAYIGKRTIINSKAKVGCCAIVNSGAVVEHDCCVGDFAHISPGAILCGQVCIGDDTHIGAGAVVRQQIFIGEHTIIGAGSVVVQNIPDHRTAYGNPCKVVE